MLKKSIQERPPCSSELDTLFSASLFAGITPVERAIIEQLLPPSVSLYPPETPVILAGEIADAIGILVDGTLSVVREGERRKVIHRILSPGDVFGVSSLFGKGEPFPTTVCAKTNATILFLSQSDLVALFTAVPRIAQRYVEILTEKIRFLNQRLDTLAGRSAEERVAAYLATHALAGGILGTTKSALASSLGLGRASLYRILDHLEENGLIKALRDRIEVPDVEALKMFIKNRKEL